MLKKTEYLKSKIKYKNQKKKIIILIEKCNWNTKVYLYCDFLILLCVLCY